MIKELQRPSSWTGKAVLLTVTVLALNLHQSQAPERALAAGGTSLVLGSGLGLVILAIVLARLFAKNIPLIGSDRAALVAVIALVVTKIAIARVLMPL